MSILLPLPGSFPKQAISSSEYKFVGGRGDLVMDSWDKKLFMSHKEKYDPLFLA